jgi:hypothetical protein
VITFADWVRFNRGRHPGAFIQSRNCRDVRLLDSNTNVSMVDGKDIILVGFERLLNPISTCFTAEKYCNIRSTYISF